MYNKTLSVWLVCHPAGFYTKFPKYNRVMIGWFWLGLVGCENKTQLEEDFVLYERRSWKSDRHCCLWGRLIGRCHVGGAILGLLVLDYLMQHISGKSAIPSNKMGDARKEITLSKRNIIQTMLWVVRFPSEYNATDLIVAIFSQVIEGHKFSSILREERGRKYCISRVGDHQVSWSWSLSSSDGFKSDKLSSC